MRKSILLIGALIIASTSCKDDDINYGPAAAGDEVLFSAEHAQFEMNGKDSRTVYGEREGNEYPIYWVNNDEIGIFCPQAASHPNTPNNEFYYKVVVEGDKQSTGTLAKVNPGENGLQWGEGDEHDFYAIYPATASKGGQSATTVLCNIPVNQDPIKIEKDDNDDKTYIAYPNMNLAYMYAHAQVSRKDNGDKPIALDFKPLVTVLDITINGPKAGDLEGDECQVSLVSIRSSEDIAGDFLLTVTDDPANPDDGKCTPVANGRVDNVVSIPIQKDGAPLTLKSGEKLKIKAFLLPYANPDATTTTVTVNMVGKGSNTKILKTAEIQSQKVNITSLPALKGTDFYYWMTAMDKRTYFSQLSIPGSHNSYSVDPEVTGTNTVMGAYQKLTVEDQFKAGARAFSFMVGFNANEAGTAVEYQEGGWRTESSTNWNNDYPLYVFDANTQKSSLKDVLDSYVKMLDDAISKYNTDYKPKTGRDCQEFIVLNINYKQIATSGTNNEGKYKEVRRWIREVDRILDTYSPTSSNGISLVSNLGSQTTIEDLMGKIVVLVNYQAPTLPQNEGKVSKGWGWIINPTERGEEYGGFTYNPSTDAKNYVFLQEAFDMTGSDIMNKLYSQNDRDIDYGYYMKPGNSAAITVWKQHLERLENPYVTVPVDYTGRISKKIDITEEFFAQAVENNVQEGDAGLMNWYVNNLGGFCVVNDEASYKLDQGQSGNTVTAAGEINKPIYEYLRNKNTKNGPCGIVLMNFYGCKTLQNAGVETNTYGVWLPQAIMENNYLFELKRKGGPETDLVYDSSYNDGGDMIK